MGTRADYQIGDLLWVRYDLHGHMDGHALVELYQEVHQGDGVSCVSLRLTQNLNRDTVLLLRDHLNRALEFHDELAAAQGRE
ncbi:MAG TPA: hypothetical protein VFZ61_33680 [Polyangiales bacterium]